MREQLAQLLLDTKSVLDTHGIKFWLDSGTLLGAVRDGNFIPWERDVDLGTWSHTIPEDTKQAVVKDLRGKGYKVLNAVGHMNVRGRSVWLDIAYYGRMNEDAVLPMIVANNPVGRYLGYARTVLSAPKHYNDINVLAPLVCGLCGLIPHRIRKYGIGMIEKLLRVVGYNMWSIPTEYFNELATVKLNGTEFSIPAHPEEYLAWRYGKD